MATQDDYIRTALRVPPGLHGKIHEAAKGNNRTFNAEIVARLEQTFAPDDGGTEFVSGLVKMLGIKDNAKLDDVSIDISIDVRPKGDARTKTPRVRITDVNANDS